MWVWMWILAPRALRCGGSKCGPPAGLDAASGGRTRSTLNAANQAPGLCGSCKEPNPTDAHERPRTTTPGQAGPPAEFKHINKRRRRNLRGFP
jgi:hypothetical protein